MSLNHVCVMGRLGKDPELRHTQSGTAVASFSLAVDRDFKSKETGEKETDWLDVVAWRNTAEFVSKYFTKGRVAIVDGKLQTRKWQDKSGNNRVSVEILADNVYFGDSKHEGNSTGNHGSYGVAPSAYGTPTSYSPAPMSGQTGFAELDDQDGELPF